LYGNVVQIVPGGRLRAVIEVIDVVVVEVDGLLHQPHAEQLDAEVEIGLRIVDGRGDVVEAENLRRHRSMLFQMVAE
jgi:hypothetical protein